VWRDEGAWWTNFPPPYGFTGEELGHWSEEDYARECSVDECDLLDAARETELADLKAEGEAERNTFFAELQEDLGGLRDSGPDDSPLLPRDG
jgi:hypothetical protein